MDKPLKIQIKKILDNGVDKLGNIGNAPNKDILAVAELIGAFSEALGLLANEIDKLKSK